MSVSAPDARVGNRLKLELVEALRSEIRSASEARDLETFCFLFSWPRPFWPGFQPLTWRFPMPAGRPRSKAGPTPRVSSSPGDLVPESTWCSSTQTAERLKGRPISDRCRRRDQKDYRRIRAGGEIQRGWRCHEGPGIIHASDHRPDRQRTPHRIQRKDRPGRSLLLGEKWDRK